MPNRANYPVDFNPYPLYVPGAPPEMVKRTVELHRQDDSINVAELPDGCEVISAYENVVVCSKYETVPNPNYELGMRYYEEAKAKYEHQLAIQNEWLPKWKAEEAAEQEAAERALLAKLKAKYE